MTTGSLPHSARRPRAGAGFTLVELLVALLLSMLLAIGLLSLQKNLGTQRLRASDAVERDSELRSAMDIVTQDISSSAYLFGNLTQPCDAIFSYSGNPTPMYFVHHQIDAMAASSGTALMFGGVTLNYPTGTTPSDVLVATTAANASIFNDASAPQIGPNSASTLDPVNTGKLLTSPPAGAALPAAGDFALLSVSIPNAVGSGTQNACFRVKVVAANAGTNEIDTAGSTYMPAGAFAAYQPTLTAAGFGTLGDGEFLNSGKLVDMGAAGNGNQVTTAYYIDNSGAYPVLMRATYSLTDDTVLSQQQIAAGVVSLQVRFKVGAGANYYSAAQVTTNQAWGQVCAVRVAMIARTLSDDPDPTYTWKPTALTPGTTSKVSPGTAWGFTDYPIPSSLTHRRYMLQTTEVPVRNTLWTKSGAVSC